jgi:DNA ligase (NAD+)
MNKKSKDKFLNKASNIEQFQSNLKMEEIIISKKDNIKKEFNKSDYNKLKSDPNAYLSTLTNQELVNLIQELNKKYYIKGESVITDNLYDYIKEYLSKIEPNNPILTQIGISDISKNKVLLPYHMSSMDKIKNDEKTIKRWLNKYNTISDGYIISDKLDGISGLLNIYNKDGKIKVKLYTRGDQKTGQDISHLIPFINIKNTKNILKERKNEDKIAIRGELIISKKNFEILKKEHPEFKKNVKNVRNVVAGICNSQKPDLTIAKYIDFVGYEYISKGENTKPIEQFKRMSNFTKMINIVNYNYIKNKNSTELLEYLSKKLEERKRDGEYDIDGIIVLSNSIQERVKEGNPDYAFAFKNIKTMESGEVMVIKVKWDISKDKYFKPVVEFTPIELGGVIVKNSSGFNGKFIKDNKIGAGSRLIIVRRGDVIPYIDKILSPSETGKAMMPEPKEIWRWNETKVDIMLNEIEEGKELNIELNKELNKELIIKEISYFSEKMCFKGLKKGTITKLYESGIIKSIKNLIELNDINTKTYKRFKREKIVGIGDKSKDNIINTINSTIKNGVSQITFMVASNKLGRGFGEKKIKLIIDKYPEILNDKIPSIIDLIKIEGIDKKTAETFIKNYPKYKLFVEELENLINPYLKKLTLNKNVNKNVNNNIKDKKFVFTGFRDKDLEDYIKENKGEIQSSLNTKTDYLIVKNKETVSSKKEKAEELKIKIITKDEFYKMKM